MAQPVVHFEIGVSNRQRGKKFYEELFGWRTQEVDGHNYTLIHPANEKSIGGGLWQPPSAEAYLTIYVQVDDLQQYVDKAAELGAKVVLPPTPIEGIGASAAFRDPDGNLIGLFCPAVQPQK